MKPSYKRHPALFKVASMVKVQPKPSLEARKPTGDARVAAFAKWKAKSLTKRSCRACSSPAFQYSLFLKKLLSMERYLRVLEW